MAEFGKREKSEPQRLALRLNLQRFDPKSSPINLPDLITLDGNPLIMGNDD